MKLSKTDFLIFQDCPHNAWVKIHEPEVFHASPLSAFDHLVIETGNEVDQLARNLFPGGVLIERGDREGTKTAIVQKTAVIYQPHFETEKFVAASDILVWNSGSLSYDIYEVKASTTGEHKKQKEEIYANDLAFQLAVLRARGVPIGRAYIVRLNPEYIRGDNIDLQSLFAIDDFTDRVDEISAEVGIEMNSAYGVLSQATIPAGACGCIYRGRSSHCTTFSRINQNVPEYSVHDIARIGNSKRKLAELVDNGVLDIQDVPDEFELSAPQLNQVKSAKTGKPHINSGGIRSYLDALKYPLAFLDYETFPAAIPRFPGFRPFDQIPFQFSLHIIPEPGAEAAHHEFLYTEELNPDAHFINALLGSIPPNGQIVSWNKPFEATINARLASRLPQYAGLLGGINERMVDLRDIFSGQLYVHPEFKGKTSIKAILPVLVAGDETTYKDLAIQDGAMATETWNRLVTGKPSIDELEEVRRNLLEYCKLDTLAMVKILYALQEF